MIRRLMIISGLLSFLTSASKRLDPPLDSVKEYCQSEFFNATCGKNEVILMESARYGRMRSGRCVTGSYGYLGCSIDVIWYLHRKCSGRSHCRVHTMDPVLHATQPCPKDLASYLEANYRCITGQNFKHIHDKQNPEAYTNKGIYGRNLPVTTDEQQTCLSKGFIQIFTSGLSSLEFQTPVLELPSTVPSPASFGYLASLFASERGQGTRECPWHITVDHGQRVRIILEAFGGSQQQGANDLAETGPIGSSSSDVCYEVGTIVEGVKISPLKACTTFGGSGSVSDPVESKIPPGSGASRLKPLVVYLSEVNNITVFLHPKQVLKELSEFVYRYDAVGCSTLQTPPGGWMRAERDSITLGCYNLRETWHVTCSDGFWVGQMPNCTVDFTDSNQDAIVQDGEGDFDNFPLGILLVVAIGVSLGVFMGGVLLSIVSLFMKRSNRQRLDGSQRSPLAPPLVLVDDTDRFDDVTTMTLPRHLMTCDYLGESGCKTSLGYSKITRMTSCPEHYKLECCSSAPPQNYRSFSSCVPITVTPPLQPKSLTHNRMPSLNQQQLTQLTQLPQQQAYLQKHPTNVENSETQD